MRNKWMRLAVLCVMICILTACGFMKNAQVVQVTEEKSTSYSESDEKLVYIEIDPSFDVDTIRMSLTPAAQQGEGGDIPLSYSAAINGCMLTLGEGEYCVRLQNGDKRNIHDRYFVVDEAHSYYHIRFTPRIAWWGTEK